jgi:hypothetical protein
VCADRQPQDWTLQIPLSALVDLQDLPLRMYKLEAENEQLRKQIEALRLIQSQTLEKLADLMRERMKG